MGTDISFSFIARPEVLLNGLCHQLQLLPKFAIVMLWQPSTSCRRSRTNTHCPGASTP
jgi:hypothetical protein